MMALETFFILFIVLFLILPLGITVLTIIGEYKMFEKAGVPGWKAIIPFYNTYVAAVEVGKLHSDWGLAAAAGIFFPIIGIFIFLCASINVNYAIAKKFGADDTGIILTIIFPPIMYCVYGFGKATYRRDIDVPEHGIFGGVVSSAKDAYNNNSHTKEDTTEESEVRKFCPSCGAPVKPTDKFCKSCGNSLK